MGTATRGRMLAVATVATITILGSAYLLGHRLGSSGAGSGRPMVAAQGRADTGSTYPGASGPASGVAPGSGSGTAAETPNQDRPDPTGPATTAAPAPSGTGPEEHAPIPAYGGRLPPEPDGPQGARLTTGTSDVALTFDDGPDPQFTPQILALLREFQVRATFCLVGENAQAYPELVRAIVADGHTLCNHSWSHDVNLGRRPYAEILADLTRTRDAIRAAAPGAPIAYYRQPGGNWTSALAAAARQLDMTPLHWTVDPRDWSRPGAGAIVATVTANAFPGAIVLLHDAGGDRRGTVSALYPILVSLGRRFALTALPTDTPTGVATGAPDAGPGADGGAG